MISYSEYSSRFGDYTNNTSSANLTRGLQWVNDGLRYLTKTFYFNERSFTVPGGTQASVQWYNLPFDFEAAINVTVNINGVLWVPDFAGNRKYWDALNVITFVQDYPLFYYIYAGQLGIFPMPATTGYPIQINYKSRIRNLDTADYTIGTVAVSQYKTGEITATASSAVLTGSTSPYTTVLTDDNVVTLTSTGSLPTGFVAGTSYFVVSSSGTGDSTQGNNQAFTFSLSLSQGGAAITPTTAGEGQIVYITNGRTVTGAGGAAWYQDMAMRWIKITPSATNASSGDGKFYQIERINSATSLTLMGEYESTGNQASITGAAYSIMQIPLLPEDYQDLPLWWALTRYFSTIVKDEAQAKVFQDLYDRGYEELNKAYGSKVSSPVLLDTDVSIYNPNLFLMNQQQL